MKTWRNDMDTFFQGDTVRLFSDTGADYLATATKIEFIVTKPSGTVVMWTAIQVDPTIYTDDEEIAMNLTNECIVYTTKTTDLDEVGLYRFQSHITWGSDSEIHGDIERFKVIAPLE
jgi:hypothetical protein